MVCPEALSSRVKGRFPTLVCFLFYSFLIFACLKYTDIMHLTVAVILAAFIIM